MIPSERVTKARTLMLLDHPFFGALVLRMPMVEDGRIPTAQTNGREIRYSPKFVSGLTDPELMGVLAHEVMHVAHGHCWRRDGRDAADWNKAADYAINHIIEEAGLTLPACVLRDPALTGAAEQIYSRIHQPPPPSGGGAEEEGDQADQKQNKETQQPPDETASNGSEGPNVQPPADKPHQGKGNPLGEGDTGQPTSGEGVPELVPDPGGCGAVADAPADADPAEEEAEWKVAIAQAAMAAKAQGRLPGCLDRLVQSILDPKVPWRVVLRDFVEMAACNDYNWSRPNRRYLSGGIVLPSLISEELPEIVIAIDTSGSIGPAELDQFAAEVSAVLGTYETTIHLVWCDARVQDTQTLTRADLPLKLSPKGGGGTDFRPVFDWVAKEGIQPAALIYLTDMWGTFPSQEPDYPVLWVRTTNHEAPWGQTVTM